ncbi:MAG: NAD-dependent epimerase/dehydratase family protein [Acetobacteraceae bacterium]|nr:NAD-dependent epimerase/dehydratase family protein [Acetobacteraceae bacterium]
MALYLITGGAGFIGSHLADALLAAGHKVRVLDDFSTGKVENLNPRCAVLRGDAADPTIVAQAFAGITGCFHLAAVASVQRGNEAWFDTHRANQSATVAVLEAASNHGQIPVVYASSAAIYGNVGDQVATETLRPAPQTAYGADKYGSELHAAIGFAVHRVPSVGLRFFNVYGPRQDPASPYSGVISIFAGKLAAGQGLTVHGDGGQTRDFVYVADVVHHLCAAMAVLRDHPAADVVNVCTGRATSVLDLAHILSALQGNGGGVSHGPARLGDIRQSLGDPAAAIALLGVAAEMNLRDGLALTLQSLRQP